MHLQLLQIVPVILVVGAVWLVSSLTAAPPSKDLTHGELMYPEDETEGR